MSGFRANLLRPLAGYGRAFECDDVDECATGCLNECDPIATYCINTPGGYGCQCRAGFVLDHASNTCVDVDECSMPPSVNECHEHARCLNTNGSHVCLCESGFFGNGTHCEDINECVDMNMLEVCAREHNASCANTLGSYACFCGVGMRQADANANDTTSTVCVDIDECVEIDQPCMSHMLETAAAVASAFTDDQTFVLDASTAASLCENTLGSYRCACRAGYVWHGGPLFACLDVDECAVGTHMCDDNAACVNTQGSYVCMCHTGWNKTGDFYCSGK